MHTPATWPAPQTAFSVYNPNPSNSRSSGWAAIDPNAYRPRQPADNSSAWWSLGSGIVAVLATSTLLIHSTAGLVVSTTGILAIITGVRAIKLRRAGHATARIPQIIGIALGSIATLIMLFSFARFILPTGGTIGAAGQDSQSQSGQTLDAWPTSTLPDHDLDSYHAIPVTTQRVADSGCPGLYASKVTVPDSGRYSYTPARIEQRDINLQMQGITQGLAAEKARIGHWPSAIYLDPQSGLVSTGCQGLGLLPANTVLGYAMSKDGTQVALEIRDDVVKVGSLWRSKDSTIYWEGP